MSVALLRESKILKDATEEAIQALEFMSSVLNQHQNNEADAIREMWTRNVSLNAIADALMNPQPSAVESNKALAAKVAGILSKLYKVQQDLFDLGNDINNVVMDIRDIQASRETPVLITEESS